MGKDKERPKPKKVVPPQLAAAPVLKVPRRLAGISPDGVAADARRPVWRTSLLDLEYQGSWSWNDGSTSLTRLLAFAREQERLTWKEIRTALTGGAQRRGPRNKFIPIEHLCKEAQDRLQALDLDDLDELFRFRDGNMGRLWGRMDTDGGLLVFYPIWWDGHHKVCPGKDNG